MILNSKFKTSFVASLILLISIGSTQTGAEEKTKTPVKKKDKASSKLIEKGKVLILSNNCTVCHTMENKGGCLAPPFDGISKRRTREFLMARITADSAEEEKFHTKFQAQELMPHVRIPKDQANKIADFLLTLPEPQKGFKVIGHSKKTAEERKKTRSLIVRLKYKEDKQRSNSNKGKETAPGKKLVFEKGCLACHSIGNAGGRFAPKLDKVGSRKTKEQIAKQILAAELAPNIDSKETPMKSGRMPASNLSIEEILAISNYLKSLK